MSRSPSARGFRPSHAGFPATSRMHGLIFYLQPDCVCKHRRRRERRPMVGVLLHLDASSTSGYQVCQEVG